MSALKGLNISGIPNRGNARYPSGRIWPCHEFSLGYVAPRPDERLDSRKPDFSHPSDDGTASAAPLDLRNVPNSDKCPRCLLSAGSTGVKGPKRPERYGRKGITGYGKKMVKSVGALIDRYYPNHRVTFATVTMPSMAARERSDLARAWPVLVNELMKWLKRRLKREGMPPVIVSVTEVQPRRLTETGEGYLHLHMLWLNRPAKAGHWSIDVEDLKRWVREWLIRRELFPPDGHVNVDVRRVTGEKVRYLAKYCSKGSSVIAEFASDVGWESCPSQWWNTSKEARNWVKDHLIEGKTAGCVLDMIVNASFDTGQFGHFKYLYHIDIEVAGRRLNVGWRGGLQPDCYYDAINLCYNTGDIARIGV